MKYAYQRQGGPILSWDRAAPQQSRGADAKALGSLGDDTLGLSTFRLPKPGAPEQVSFGGLGCSGCKGKQPMGGVVDSISALPVAAKIAGAVGLFYAYKMLKKKR